MMDSVKELFYIVIELLFLAFVAAICILLIDMTFNSIVEYSSDDQLVVGAISTSLLFLIATVCYNFR